MPLKRYALGIEPATRARTSVGPVPANAAIDAPIGDANAVHVVPSQRHALSLLLSFVDAGPTHDADAGDGGDALADGGAEDAALDAHDAKADGG